MAFFRTERARSDRAYGRGRPRRSPAAPLRRERYQEPARPAKVRRYVDPLKGFFQTAQAIVWLFLVVRGLELWAGFGIIMGNAFFEQFVTGRSL